MDTALFPLTTKKCGGCKVEKPISEFWADAGRKNGASWCKACRSISRKANREIHREKINKDKILKKYNITRDEYDKILNAQNGVCAICGERETSIDGKSKKPRSLALDHDHANEMIRGFLCHRCNVMVGYSREKPELLRLAADYLERWATIHGGI